MNNIIKILIALLGFIALSCTEILQNEKKAVTHDTVLKKQHTELSKNFKEYWYDGTAEITSYELRQARYGEIRKGKAVLVFVTEPFLMDKQVKADSPNDSSVSVLKLNTMKNFLTGIYPYTLMTSTFYPVHEDAHALKVASSIQEWCGHVYMQLNNRERFEIALHSYFQGEADQKFSIEKNHLENEIWTKIRVNPKGLPAGKIKMIPAMDYLRLLHKEIKAYDAETTLMENKDTYNYMITYSELSRSVTISFNKTFPHEILGWTETYKSDFGDTAKRLISEAKKIKTIKSAYWKKNANTDVSLRDTLGI
jgi:hypothetical protein